jgi:hypothetical protein
MLYSSDNSGSKNSSFLDLKAILELFWCEKMFDSESDKGISVARPISNWLNAVVILKFSISVSCCISSFLIWLLVGREDLEGDKIKDGEDDVEIVDYEKFFLNYAGRCAILLHFANFVIIITAVKTASMYRF